ncbi:MAG: hypothetical protein KDD67_05485 [Ignavibacteriae bacterium]|nr:hypothetical protein [Ignavibacteriota bacterium]MCB9216222.1 hypothetical protein [Ignavibacteria bacterium]
MNKRFLLSFSRNLSTLLLVLLPLIPSILTVGCEENPVQEEHHAEPVGLIVTDGDTEIVRVEQNVVTGSFQLTQETLSPHYQLQFLDEDGEMFLPDDPDFTPSATIEDPTLLEVVRDQPDDWNFHLKGLKEGTTTIKLVVKHGSHNDYESPAIPVTVIPNKTVDNSSLNGVI